MKKSSRYELRYDPGKHVGMIMMLERRDHMYADPVLLAVIAWPLQKDWYPSENGTRMLDKLWDMAFNWNMALKV